jgi:hypothetical protein
MHGICQEEPTHDMALIFHSFKMVLEKNEGRFLFLSLSLITTVHKNKTKNSTAICFRKDLMLASPCTSQPFSFQQEAQYKK